MKNATLDMNNDSFITNDIISHENQTLIKDNLSELVRVGSLIDSQKLTPEQLKSLTNITAEQWLQIAQQLCTRQKYK